MCRYRKRGGVAWLPASRFEATPDLVRCEGNAMVLVSNLEEDALSIGYRVVEAGLRSFFQLGLQ
jgi:hypothetical protein